MNGTARRLQAAAALAALAALSIPGGAEAQEVPFLLRRQFDRPFIDTAVFNLLYLGVYTDDSDSRREKESDNGGAPSFYYGDREFAGGEADLDFLLSPSPLYLSYREKRLGDTHWAGRLELWGNANLYREGFYRAGGAFEPTFRYEGFDAGFGPSLGRPLLAGTDLADEHVDVPRLGRLGLGKLYLEATPQARVHWFGHGRNKERGETIPDAYFAFTPQVLFEYDAIKWDLCDLIQQRGLFFQTWAQYEANDSDRAFGGPGGKSTLPSDFLRWGGFAEAWAELWRLRGSYVNLGESVEWEIKDRKDRVHAYNVRRPTAPKWIKWRTMLGIRDILLPANYLRPYFEVAWLEGPEGAPATTRDSRRRGFVGAGVHFQQQLAEEFAIHLDYEWSANESRAPVSDRDKYGEHIFYARFEYRIFTHIDRRVEDGCGGRYREFSEDGAAPAPTACASAY